MKLFLVPSSVGSASEHQFLTSFVVNNRIAIDAGSIGFFPDVSLQKSIKHVLLSHAHIDHVASLGAFIDNVCEPGKPPVTIHCSDDVADVLRDNYFNNKIWPNVLRIPSRERPYAKLQVFAPGVEFEVDKLRVIPVDVDHAVPTVGFIVRDTGSSFVFSGDMMSVAITG